MFPTVYDSCDYYVQPRATDPVDFRPKPDPEYENEPDPNPDSNIGSDNPALARTGFQSVQKKVYVISIVLYNWLVFRSTFDRIRILTLTMWRIRILLLILDPIFRR
jgi:hypothetical protein